MQHPNHRNTLDMTRKLMACEFRIILGNADEYYARQVAEAAFEEISRLEKKFNCFDPTSELSYVNAWAHVREVIVSPELFEILQLAKALFEKTGGIFDVTVGAAVNLWRSAEKLRSVPDARAIRETVARTSSHFLELDPARNSVRIIRDGLLINLGAIGKGYAVRQAAQLISQYGISSGLVSSGDSTVYALGPQPDGRPWQIGIRHPQQADDRLAVVELQERALSTSGGPRQRDANVCELYDHIIDPSTCEPARTELVSASALTSDPVIADALSTAFYLGGKAFTSRYCLSHKGVEAILVEEQIPGEYKLCHVGG